MSHTTRESWLAAAVEALRPVFAAQAKHLPDKLRVSCGWPSRGGTSVVKIRMGECWSAERSQDNTVEIFVSPRVGDSNEALAVLAHELVHAALFAAEKRHGHGKSFQTLAAAIGLEEPWTSSVPGPTLKAVLADLGTSLGAYPGSPLRPEQKEKKQTTRMLKCLCSKCGYTLRTTQKWIDVAVPYCPADETRMVVEGGSIGEKPEGEGEEGGATLEGLAEGNA